MKKTMLIPIFLVLMIKLAMAITINEVMYAPNQTSSETDTEWVEIYNNDTYAINLANWKIDGYNFDDVGVAPQEYIVIARELIDGNDTDLDSFESVWGNNDGVWNESDGNYKALDGYFALTNNDTIIITNENNTIIEWLSYDSSFGAYNNGRTLEKINVTSDNSPTNWGESLITGGTPGKTNSLTPKEGTTEIKLLVEVVNPKPKINSVNITPDDGEKNGTQILPEAGSNKTVSIRVEATAWANNTEAYATFKGERLNLTKKAVVNSSTSIYELQIAMAYFEEPKKYALNITLKEGDYEVTEETSFDYLPLLATIFNKDQLSFFQTTPGTASNEENITLSNAGNVLVDFEISGTNINAEKGEITVDAIEFALNKFWQPLSLTPQLLNLNLSPKNNTDLTFRVNLPSNIQPNSYLGKVRLTSLSA
ncbi:lamin tail domain-containing protein [Candidatus Woesearchaeota archaeon]|nr:lamin tail domain-containing protein [Candidatus Woesearchaeota archaeon]